ncbi:TonB-dependent receptor [Pedobacter duraquae]|uniref:TonB-dependent receptor-like protein n=1 Tax=Pedobacter duraquae TaxID=425511 RepID=A0A4R6IQC7_9SPHI|nr:TonB-dependent receptor [Pedobacter duraquae]TDO24493.1 TonB-dependent receptor-like protein [Pedobacter duraquae]
MRYFLLTSFLLLSFSLVRGQTILKGTVYDEHSKPIEYATVTLKNIDAITFTDSAGRFSFKVGKKLALPTYDLRIAVVGKRTIERPISLKTLTEGAIFNMVDLSLTLNEIEINQVRRSQNSNSSIIFDRQALEQTQAFSLGDVLNNLPGKKFAPPALQNVQNITLRSEADGLQSMNNSFGVAIIIDDIQQSNNANMQNRSVGKWGVNSSAISATTYGRFDVPFSGLDIREIPVDNIESVEVITGVAPAKYGDLTSGAVIVNRQAGKTPYQFSTRINGASTNFSLSKGYILDKKWGAINYGLNYLYANPDPSDKVKIYERVSANLMWTSYLFKNFKNTISLDYGTRTDDVRIDPDDDQAIRTFAKSRNLSVSNRSSLTVESNLLKRIDFSLSYSNNYSETYNQRFFNGEVKGMADKDTDNEIYQGYYIPGTYLSVEHIKGNPVNMNGNLSLSNDVYTGKILHKLSLGTNLYYAQNHGQGVIVDPTKPRWANQNYQNERPYSYESLPDILNYGIYLQDNFKVNLFKKPLTFNPGVRYDVQNAKGYVQPRVNMSYALNDNINFNAAYGLSVKGPSLAHRYPAPSYVDLVLLNNFTGYVNESVFLVYTDKIVADNSKLKSSKSNQLELGLNYKKDNFTTSLFGYYKRDLDGFSNLTSYNTYTLPEFDYTYVKGGPPIVTPNGKYRNRYVAVNNVANDLNSKNYGLEWSISVPKIRAIETSINLNNSFSYSDFKNATERVLPAEQVYIDLGRKAWFGVYPPTAYTNWNLMTKISTTTHIPKLGFVVNFLADVTWQTETKTQLTNVIPTAYLDEKLTRYEIPVFDATNPDYGFLKMSSDANTKTSLPFPVANLSVRISKEIRQKIRFSVNAYNFLNIKTQYLNPNTGSKITYSTPTSVGAELSIKF